MLSLPTVVSWSLIAVSTDASSDIVSSIRRVRPSTPWVLEYLRRTMVERDDECLEQRGSR